MKRVGCDEPPVAIERLIAAGMILVFALTLDAALSAAHAFYLRLHGVDA